jgi:hypothetical protein
MRIIAALAVSVVLLLPPSIAAAGDVTCVWRSLPEDVRAGAVKAYSDDHPEKIFDGVKAEIVGEAMIKCISFPKNQRAADKVAETVGLALGTYAAQLSAEAKLGMSLKIEADTLNQAYGRIDPKRRREMAVAFRTDRKPADAVATALIRAMSEAYPGLADLDTDGPDFDQLASYFAARALREEAELKF